MQTSLKIYLIDLPTFPKGVISLSFPAIASAVSKKYSLVFIDLNLENFKKKHIRDFKQNDCLFIGLKVSAQNHKQAIELSQELKKINDDLLIVWGGEFPTLMPHQAILHADKVVCGAFESVSKELISDIENNNFKKVYDGKKNYDCSKIPIPDFSILKYPNRYSQTMGFPMETSRGCDKKCTFCMVHTMQPVNNYKTLAQLKKELTLLTGKFVNVIDYNIGANKQHLKNVITAFSESRTLGWMGEMCLETLDDDELIEQLANSGCKIIYCGLESIDEDSLLSINKAKTNNIGNYSRIIKKVQKYGIQIATGIIIGLEGSTRNSIDSTFSFFQKIGVIYAKITFLTYNPGTKVYQSMKRVGEYLTEEIELFDGNHFTYLPFGVKKDEVQDAMIKNAKKFYSDINIRKRAFNAGVKNLALQEFILFNHSYREAYLQWFESDIFENPNGFTELLDKKYKKSNRALQADKSITQIRKKIFNGR